MSLRRACLCWLSSVGTSVAAVAGGVPGAEWRQYSDVESAGWSRKSLEEAFQRAGEAGSAAVFVAEGGVAVCAWGDVERPLNAHSIRKPILGSMIGIAVSEGDLSLGDTLADLGINDIHALTEQERSATVLDLLRGRSGVYHEAAYETAGKRRERPARGSHIPGSHFWSNNWDFNALLTIYEQESGNTFFDEFERVIASPIGMEDFRAAHGEYHFERERSLHPAYPLRISARDLARFGTLYLRDGRWDGRTIVPAEWTAESTRAHTVFDDGGGYTGTFQAGAGFGFMWWVYPAGCQPPGRPTLDAHDIVAAQGAGGHVMLLIRELDLVIVHRTATDDGHRVGWNDVWSIAEDVVRARSLLKTGAAERRGLIVRRFER